MKAHRTALFIDVSETASQNTLYVERVERLVESLNYDGDSDLPQTPDTVPAWKGTIKVDVFSVADSVRPGVAWYLGRGFDVEAAMNYARAHAYDLVLFATESTMPHTITERTKP